MDGLKAKATEEEVVQVAASAGPGVPMDIPATPAPVAADPPVSSSAYIRPAGEPSTWSRSQVVNFLNHEAPGSLFISKPAGEWSDDLLMNAVKSVLAVQRKRLAAGVPVAPNPAPVTANPQDVRKAFEEQLKAAEPRPETVTSVSPVGNVALPSGNDVNPPDDFAHLKDRTSVDLPEVAKALEGVEANGPKKRTRRTKAEMAAARAAEAGVPVVATVDREESAPPNCEMIMSEAPPHSAADDAAGWEEEARRMNVNALHWRERAEKAEAEVDMMKRQTPDAEGYRLFINCVPNHPYVEIDIILEPLKALVVETRDDKTRFPEHPYTLDYMQGQARVAALLMKQRASLQGNIVVDGRSASAKAVLDVLIPRALEVVRGF